MPMTLYPAGSLALQRTLNEANLPEVATVSRAGAPVDDGEGGSTPGAPVTFTVACRRTAIAGTGPERLIADQLQETGLERLVFPVGTDLRASDTVTVEGAVYDVRARIPDGSYGTQGRAIVKRLPASATASVGG